jgi:hypothetical protein
VSPFSWTCYLTQREAVKLAKIFFAVKDIKEARQRLDQLMQEESQNNTARILGGVDRLERKFMEGERMHSACNPSYIESFFSLDGKASTGGVWKVPGTYC